MDMKPGVGTSLSPEEVTQLEQDPLLRRIYEKYVSLLESFDAAYRRTSETKIANEVVNLSQSLRRLRGEDTPDAVGLDAMTKFLAMRDAQSHLDEVLGELWTHGDLLARFVVDRRAGREPTVPMRMVTTVNMSIDKIFTSAPTSSDVTPSDEEG